MSLVPELLAALHIYFHLNRHRFSCVPRLKSVSKSVNEKHTVQLNELYISKMLEMNSSKLKGITDTHVNENASRPEPVTRNASIVIRKLKNDIESETCERSTCIERIQI